MVRVQGSTKPQDGFYNVFMSDYSCHIYMSGCGFYIQIQYLTVMYHHSNSVTYISSCKHIKTYKIHPEVWCRPVR